MPTIHPNVKIIENAWFNCVNPSPFKNGILTCSIIIPLFITIIAAIICASNFTSAGSPFTSSIKHTIIITKLPRKKPINLR